VVGLLAIQLIRPTPPGPQGPGDGPIAAHIPVPGDVEDILRTACYDCHSAETRWPWYSRIAPVSWLVTWDVRRGRADLDFSNWSTDAVREPTPVQRLRWTCEEPSEDRMPPLSYRLLHPKARLTEREKNALCAWTARALAEL
jgi:hypothetical protein